MKRTAAAALIALATCSAHAQNIDWDASFDRGYLVPTQPVPTPVQQQQMVQQLNDQAFEHATEVIDKRVHQQQCDFGFYNKRDCQ